jgi:hypothetical protein
MIEGFVRDEVYYREARAMGLDQDDPVVRQRMRQKLEFLLEDLATQVTSDDAQLTEFMQRNPDRFRKEPRLSFSHVYLNPDKRPDLAADAVEILGRLNGRAPPKAEGDRTLVEPEYSLADANTGDNAVNSNFKWPLERQVYCPRNCPRMAASSFLRFRFTIRDRDSRSPARACTNELEREFEDCTRIWNHERFE